LASRRRYLVALRCLRDRAARKRPADVIGNAVKVMRIATGEETEELDSVKTAAQETWGAWW
jgi:hypothetical protein